MLRRFHSVDNLCTYIENARQVTNLDTQIARREKDLEVLEQLQGIYEKLGCMNMLEVSAEEHTTISIELALLKLSRNSVERKLLEFELGTLLED
jgi:3-dehydroquinate dehydratase